MLESILPNPLHPAIVHLPIALTLLLPAFAVGAMVVIHRGARPLRAWGLAAALFAALTLSAWVSVETGEQADEKVESVVAEAPLEAHEEAAESFLVLSGVVFGIALIGLASGRIGQVGRIAGTVGAVVLLAAGWRAGHSGGALVYEHGAASAYASAPGSNTAQAVGNEDGERDR